MIFGVVGMSDLIEIASNVVVFAPRMERKKPFFVLQVSPTRRTAVCARQSSQTHNPSELTGLFDECIDGTASR